MHTIIDVTAPCAIATPDLVRALPRHVVGFTATIETALGDADLGASLTAIAQDSAFELVSIVDRAAPEENGGRTVDATFNLFAPRGTTGDAQIFALLRSIAAHHRWNSVSKSLSR